MSDLIKGHKADSGPVECLGQKFPSDQARREHYLKLLAEKLKEPAFRRQAGFPKGTDEAILAMSDPPYYTACPNPWLMEFSTRGESSQPSRSTYSREPLVVDVSEGKGDALYKAHSYHTKVPHRAIVPSILHYTDPGDVVLDAFSGSGMTGVSAQWCGSASASERYEIEAAWKAEGREPPRWGARRVILNDLSPAATFISANYNIPFDVLEFSSASKKLLDDVYREIGWMYETTHSDGVSKGRIEYTVWSEIFACPSCAGEIVFTEEAQDADSKKMRDVFQCPHCDVELTKKKLEKSSESVYDAALGRVVKSVKRKPMFICYELSGERYEKKVDENDLAVIRRISELPWPDVLPSDRMMHAPESEACWGDKWRAGSAAFTHVHHIFLPRAAHALAALWRHATSASDARMRNMLVFLVEQAIWTCSTLNRYQPQGFKQVNKFLPGVYYTPSQTCEVSPWYAIGARGNRLAKTFSDFRSNQKNVVVTTGSAAELGLPDESVDYIFTDPPFGDNLAYSELNFLVEAFHQVFTSQPAEAVMSGHQNKGLLDYYRLMLKCFQEFHRVLKSGRWMTVVFSNTQAAVWNGIQTALQEAGFVIANVSALDKKLGSFNAVTNPTSVKQDLVISAYKPGRDVEERFHSTSGGVQSLWEFVEAHLGNLPVFKVREQRLDFVKERDPRIIFDRMVAWYVRHGAVVPLSSQEFQAELVSRFSERDGMIFTTAQASAYERKRSQYQQSPQMELFVSDERSAIDWLADFLKSKPSTYQELHPAFITQVGAGWKKHEAKPELSALLENNFLKGTSRNPVSAN